MLRKEEFKIQHYNEFLLLPFEFYLYILEQEKKEITNTLLKEIQQKPSLMRDRGYSFSRELKNCGINISISAITYGEDIHIIFSNEVDSYYVINQNSIHEFSSEEYLKKYGYIKRTPLVSTLFFIQQSLDSENNIEQWAESPAIILGHFERVGSTWLMDLVNQFGRSQVEPIRQHVSLNSPVNSFTEVAKSQQIDSTFFHSSLAESPYSQIWFRNYLASQYQGELQVSKETNLFFMLPFFLDLFPDNTPIIILRRDIRGIISSFKKSNLFENWEYKDRYIKLKNLTTNNTDLDSFRYLFDTTDEENWIDILITLYIINLHQIITTTLRNNKRTKIITVSYEEMVIDRDSELSKITDLLNLELPDEIANYQSESNSKSEFNTNKKKKNPHDWIDVLTLDEINFIEKRIRERFVDIENIFGHEIADAFQDQGFLIEKNIQKKIRTKQQKPVKEVFLVPPSLTKDDIQNTIEFTSIPKFNDIPSFSIATTLVTNQEFATFLNEMKKTGITNDIYGNYLFYNPNILANRGGRIFLSNGKYKIVDGYQSHPVCWVNWIGAIAYAQWLGYTLPNLEQWQSIISQIPINTDRNSDSLLGDTTPIDFYPKNNYGIYDLYGNVKIWTNSWNKQPGIHVNTDLTLSTVGYAWNSRSERGNVTYKPYLLSSSTLGIRLVKPHEPISGDLIRKLQFISNMENSSSILDGDIFSINKQIKELLSE